MGLMSIYYIGVLFMLVGRYGWPVYVRFGRSNLSIRALCIYNGMVIMGYRDNGCMGLQTTKPIASL